MPALFTSTSMPARVSAAALTNASTEDRFETSHTVPVMAVLRSVISFRAPPGRNRMFVIAPGLEAVPGTGPAEADGNCRVRYT